MIIQKGRPAQPPVRRYPSQETDRAFMIAYGKSKYKCTIIYLIFFFK